MCKQHCLNIELIAINYIFRPESVGGQVFGITDQYRKILKFGLDLEKLNNGLFKANLYWTDTVRLVDLV